MKQVKTHLNEKQYKVFQKILEKEDKTEYQLIKETLLEKYPQIA